MPFDVIIVGAGGMGASAAYHLAARGQRVLALERFSLGHDRGSSHGLTRIIRLAYFEHPSYVPLLRRAFELWRELEVAGGQRLLHVTGGLDVGPEGSDVFEGSKRSCREHGLAHEVLTSDALRRRVPAWTPHPQAMAVFQPDAGFLVPELCIASHAALAQSRGAVIQTGEQVLDWQAGGGRVRVRTERGAYEAGQLVLSAGAWMGQLAPALSGLVVPERQVVGWFETRNSEPFAAGRFPVFVLDADEGRFYGFPAHQVDGFKIGKYHHRAERVAPDALDHACHAEDEHALREAVARYFPSANGALVASAACLFTNTPDGHFILDRDPSAPEVLLVSPCSGHGFKFCSVVGEVVADLVTRDRTAHDVALFGLGRFRGVH